MIWERSNRGDQRTRKVADRHYNRQKIGTTQFVPPGRCLVLYASNGDREAFWVTSWPFAEFTKHAWAGAWVCSAFRNEGVGLSSKLIRQAVAATRNKWRDVPTLGMITFVNEAKVKKKHKQGWCYRKAGFSPCGRTKGGLLTLQLLPADMPAPEPEIYSQPTLFQGMSPCS